MTDWDQPWPELEGCSELERYHLVQAAKKRMFSDLMGYVSVLTYGLAAIGLALVIQQVPQLFAGSLWIDVLCWTVGLFAAIYLFSRWYYRRLRRMLQVILDEREQQTPEES